MASLADWVSKSVAKTENIITSNRTNSQEKVIMKFNRFVRQFAA